LEEASFVSQWYRHVWWRWRERNCPCFFLNFRHLLISDFQDIYSDKNNEKTELLHSEKMGPASCPNLDGMRVFAWLVVTNPKFEDQFRKSRWGPDRSIGGLRTWQSWLVKKGKGNMPANMYNVALWWIDTFGMPVIVS
jgi:hypothetical protein